MKKELPEIQKDVFLEKCATFKIGGKAKYFFVAKKKEDIIKAISFAKNKKIPFFILGGGSNILISDRGFDGLVIKIQNVRSKISATNADLPAVVSADAGYPLLKLVLDSVKNNLTGLEWAIGIPGTVGGAIRGNAGAFGGSMNGIVKKVEVLDVKNLKIKNYDLKDCGFCYRDSAFKRDSDLIILSAEIELKKGNPKEIKEKIRKYLKHRLKGQPYELPSAGSIFKNPSEKVSAAELIDKSGLKGRQIGMAQISPKHANFIVNCGGAKADDVLKLIELVKKTIKKKFNIELEEEIQMVGFEK